jgi:hypothetical protein
MHDRLKQAVSVQHRRLYSAAMADTLNTAVYLAASALTSITSPHSATILSDEMDRGLGGGGRRHQARGAVAGNCRAST